RSFRQSQSPAKVRTHPDRPAGHRKRVVMRISVPVAPSRPSVSRRSAPIWPLLLLFASCALPAQSAPPAAGEGLQALARKITFEWAKSHPLFATYLGLSAEDGQLDTPSEAENA